MKKRVALIPNPIITEKVIIGFIFIVVEYTKKATAARIKIEPQIFNAILLLHIIPLFPRITAYIQTKNANKIRKINIIELCIFTSRKMWPQPKSLPLQKRKLVELSQTTNMYEQEKRRHWQVEIHTFYIFDCLC